MENRISKAIHLHSQENLSANDILRGDQLVFQALFNKNIKAENYYQQLQQEIGEKLIGLLDVQETKQTLNRIIENQIDQNILNFINKYLTNKYQEAVLDIALGSKKMLRSKLFLSQLSEPDYMYGALIELFHLVTLIQDDVIDKAECRRYVPTLNCRFSNKEAILISDLLLSKIIEELNQIINHKINQSELSKENKVKLSKFYFEKLEKLISGLIEGELYVKKITKVEDYLIYAEQKTANFFGFVVMSGNLFENINNIDINKLEQLEQDGIDFGILFQKIDDLLDYKQNEEISGKSSRDYENKIKNYLYFTLQTETVTTIETELINELNGFLAKAEFLGISDEIELMKRRINE